MSDQSHSRQYSSVNHVSLLSQKIGALYMCDDYSDVTLIVDGQRLPGHKVVLAACSDYFRALLYGGMRESTMKEIELKSTPLAAFKLLLKYVYTGQLSLVGLKEDLVLEVLELCHQYGFEVLESAVSQYLEEILNVRNVCSIYDRANLYRLDGLARVCCLFIDRHAIQIIHSDAFLTLSPAALREMLSRDSFCAPEVQIFGRVCAWWKARRGSEELEPIESIVGGSGGSNDVTSGGGRSDDVTPGGGGGGGDAETPLVDITSTTDNVGIGAVALANATSAMDPWSQCPVESTSPTSSPREELQEVMSEVRLPLMSVQELLNVVRPSGIVEADRILDAIKTKTECRDVELRHRGCLQPEENVATPTLKAQVIVGEGKKTLLDGDIHHYDMDRGFTRHNIDDGGEGIVIQLGRQYIINHIVMLLWDKDNRSYSYYIEISMDQKDWIRVVDHSSYLCRSWQKLFFEPRVVRFIRIVGTNNTINRVFHLVSFECMFTRKPFHLEQGLYMPTENVATVSRSACVSEGVSRSRNTLINGDFSNYDWDSGYTCHQLGSGAIVVQLPQPYMIHSMRLLLWDCDSREYSYYVEVSVDYKTWKIVADKRKELCRSWQILRFPSEAVVFVRIVGTHNTANEVFHCVHFECPSMVESLEECVRANAAAQAVQVALMQGQAAAAVSTPNDQNAS